jgi:lipopolysaccharide/colanic/teichoic acid biosynthesis glycosyltransferase
MSPPESRFFYFRPQSPMTQIPIIVAPKANEPLLKRPLDMILSILMLVFSAPLSLLLALAIKIEDGGPIF